MQPSTEFLTPEESAEVDKALMTAHDKFATRVAIYALRSLKQIAQEHAITVSDVTPAQMEDWVYQDQRLQAGIDSHFQQFFVQLVSASVKPLTQAAQDANVAIDDLTPTLVIKWFEKIAKR